VLSGKVLVLNQSYEPVTICSAKKAIILIYMTKAEMIAQRDGKVVHSVRNSYPYPSVIRLSRFIHVPFKKIDLSRMNILRRDNYRCQYCGAKTQDLTIDHVIPKSRGGGDSWDNLVCCCQRCNNKKGNRTPEEARMSLISKPIRPHHILFI
jgi:5-methylcytosine-specific restriction endonuclease McrA